MGAVVEEGKYIMLPDKSQVGLIQAQVQENIPVESARREKSLALRQNLDVDACRFAGQHRYVGRIDTFLGQFFKHPPPAFICTDAAHQRHGIRSAAFGIHGHIERNPADKGPVQVRIVVDHDFPDSDDFHLGKTVPKLVVD